jgi:hypothetical protein
MQVTIPDALKADIPQTPWGKLLAATPVVMTVLATMLAGLASNEMTRAQYQRSLASQKQSKAGDQWGLFQAKRLRGIGLKTEGEFLQITAEVGRLTPGGLSGAVGGLPDRLERCRAAAARLQAALSAPDGLDPAPAGALAAALDSYVKAAPPRAAQAEALVADLAALLSAAGNAAALEILGGGPLPAVGPAPAVDAALGATLKALEESRPEAELATRVASVSTEALAEALREATERARAFDGSFAPVNVLAERIEALLSRQTALTEEARAVAGLAAAVPPTADTRLGQAAEAFAVACAKAQADARQCQRDAVAARWRCGAGRYDLEARLNQAIANFYELQVRKNNIAAERRHVRSQRFFYGMLAAQMAVIISTFAMAARKRNLLWSLAAAAGLAALAFAIYVFLYV